MKRSRASRVRDVAVGEIMTRKVILATPDMTAETVVAVMLDENISGVPVVDEKGKPVGMFSKTDVVRDGQDRFDERVPVRFARVRGDEVDLGPGYHVENVPTALVRDLMAPLAFTLPESAPVSQAAALMAYEGVHRIPVVGVDGAVVGVVSTIDVLRWLAQGNGYLMRAAPASRAG
jgi:CBS domain-containing protein